MKFDSNIIFMRSLHSSGLFIKSYIQIIRIFFQSLVGFIVDSVLFYPLKLLLKGWAYSSFSFIILSKFLSDNSNLEKNTAEKRCFLMRMKNVLYIFNGKGRNPRPTPLKRLGYAVFFYEDEKYFVYLQCDRFSFMRLVIPATFSGFFHIQYCPCEYR